VLAAVLAVGSGIADLRFVGIVPQIRRQVPEGLRWRIALPLTAGIYGLQLGLGFTTYLLTYAMWALLGACVLLGEPDLGLLVGATFGLGRALPVLVLVPRFERATTQQFIADMERGPTLVGLRRIDGVALLACAMAVTPVAVAGAAGTTVRTGMADPGVADGDLVFQAQDGSGLLRRPTGPLTALPGRDPAVGGPYIAWHDRDTVTIADRATLTPVLVSTVVGVQELALTDRVLVYRRADTAGRRLVGALAIAPGGVPGDLFATRDAVSRPSVWGATTVFSVSGGSGSRVVAMNVLTGRRRTLRRAGAGSQVVQPALRGEDLLYVHTTRCTQELRLGRPDGDGRGDRVLLRLRAVAQQDGGYQRGYVDAYDGASKCPKRAITVRPGVLWTTALSAAGAFVTRLPASGRGAADLLRVPLGR
ncbi:MAG: mauF, partial [Solirubrobacterales bacterium]|nr:mauF [Solirubrobacterales bacterium]